MILSGDLGSTCFLTVASFRFRAVLASFTASRLLVMADDGAERFYRQVERLLLRHGPRVLAVRLEVDADTLGEVVFGPGRRARLLLLDHKEAVSGVLLSMADPLPAF